MKKSSVSVSFSNGTPPRKLKANNIKDARQVVCQEFNLPTFSNEALGNAHILHVYIFFNGKNHLVEEVPSRLVKTPASPEDKKDFRLKPRKREKHKHSHHGLRQKMPYAA